MYRFITIQFNVNELSFFQLLYTLIPFIQLIMIFLHVLIKQQQQQRKPAPITVLYKVIEFYSMPGGSFVYGLKLYKIKI